MTAEYPLVSIIIPCYNGEAYVTQAIESTLAQTYPSVEVIVIDDGSTDASLDVICSFGDRIRYGTGPNRGLSAARNRGIALAHGEYVKFLDADDLLLPDSLARQVAQTAQLSPDTKAVVYGDAIWVDANLGSLPGYPHRPRRLDEDPIAHIYGNSPLPTCPLHRRSYLQVVGGFDPTILAYGEELDLHLRLILDGVEFVYSPGPVYYYRQHSAPGRITRLKISKNGPLAQFDVIQRHARLIEKKTGKPLSSEVCRPLARRLWAVGRSILREGFETEANHYFAAARALDAQHCVVGNPPYPTLVGFLGPHWAEYIVARLRSGIERVGIKSHP